MQVRTSEREATASNVPMVRQRVVFISLK